MHIEANLEDSKKLSSTTISSVHRCMLFTVWNSPTCEIYRCGNQMQNIILSGNYEFWDAFWDKKPVDKI